MPQLLEEGQRFFARRAYVRRLAQVTRDVAQTQLSVSHALAIAQLPMQGQALLIESPCPRRRALLRQHQRQAGEREPQATTLNTRTVPPCALLSQRLFQQGRRPRVVPGGSGRHRL